MESIYFVLGASLLTGVFASQRSAADMDNAHI